MLQFISSYIVFSNLIIYNTIYNTKNYSENQNGNGIQSHFKQHSSEK